MEGDSPLAAGPAYTEDGIRRELGIAHEQLEVLVERCCLFRVTVDDGSALYPALQVADGAILPNLDLVLCELAGGVEDPATWWTWLLGHASATDERARWELLRDGDAAAVIGAAGRSAWAWRQ